MQIAVAASRFSARIHVMTPWGVHTYGVGDEWGLFYRPGAGAHYDVFLQEDAVPALRGKSTSHAGGRGPDPISKGKPTLAVTAGDRGALHPSPQGGVVVIEDDPVIPPTAPGSPHPQAQGRRMRAGRTWGGGSYCPAGLVH